MKKNTDEPLEFINFFGIPELVGYSECQNVSVSKENEFQNEPIFDIGYNTDKKKNVFSYLEKRIANRFVIPTVEECGYDGLFANIHPSIRIELTDIYELSLGEKLRLLRNSTRENIRHLLYEKEIDAALKTHLSRFYDTTFDKVYWIRVVENGEILFEAETGNLIKKKNHMGIYSHKSYRRKHLYLCDFALLMSDILIWSQVRKFLDGYQELSPEQIGDCIPYKKFTQQIGELFNPNEYGFCLEKKIYSADIVKELETMIGAKENDKGNAISFQQIIDLYITEGKSISLELFLKEQYVEAIPRKFSALSNIYLLIADDYLEGKEDFKYESSTSRTYAKSFQDKVVASRKLKREMNLTRLNLFFGKVEFDSLVDMSQIRRIEAEYIRLNNLVFKEPRLTDYSIRFRRLGCHKAAGLYYPLYQCICVDIEHPDSFCHELIHMIDYKNGKLSKKWDFRAIYECYVALLVENVNSDASLKKLKNSNRKYNLTYYKRSTEVFARCGEIYLSRILGLESILLKDEYDNFAYPNNPELDCMIEDYFENLFHMKEEKK